MAKRKELFGKTVGFFLLAVAVFCCLAIAGEKKTTTKKPEPVKTEIPLVQNGNFMVGAIGAGGPNKWRSYPDANATYSVEEDGDRPEVANKAGQKVKQRFVKIDTQIKAAETSAMDKDGRFAKVKAASPNVPIGVNNGFYLIVLSQYGRKLEPDSKYRLVVRARTLKGGGGMAVGVQIEPLFITADMIKRKNTHLARFQMMDPTGATMFRDKIVYDNKSSRLTRSAKDIVCAFKTPQCDKIDKYQIVVGVMERGVYAIESIEMEKIE